MQACRVMISKKELPRPLQQEIGEGSVGQGNHSPSRQETRISGMSQTGSCVKSHASFARQLAVRPAPP